MTITRTFLPCIVSTLVLFTTVLSDEGTSNRCLAQETCGKCIAENPHCAWCSQEDYATKDIPRCNRIENLRHKCDSITWPRNSVTNLVDAPLSDKGAKEEEAIQIKPQMIQLKIKPNSPVTFTMEYRQAVDYPVDLYYVMDLSNSMKDDKIKLAQLGDKLAREMGTITTNFRLGFGSFVDKITAPYVDTNPVKLAEPCPGCAAPYGFQNNMPLSLRTEEFAEKVRQSKVSGNLDSVEGGFDAIMQAIVCQKEIGWRNKSRKLLVFTTDNGFHYAGDGKLAGIIKPNDGLCHLDAQGYYAMSTSQDYPSLSQLNQKVKDYNVHIIFAVTSNWKPMYDRLKQRVLGSSTGILQNDSSNIVKLVRNQYDQLTSSVTMTDSTQHTNNIKITYRSACLGEKVRETQTCGKLKVGTTVSFNVTVEVLSCPKEKKDWTQTFRIYPVGLNEYLSVDMEIECECDCEKPANEQRFSMKCNNGNGTYECGICSCYGNKYGKECECDYESGTTMSDESACYKGNDTKPCSDMGLCVCGTCSCMKRPNPEEKIYGKHCDCDNFSCDRKDGQICGGHGKCDCGKCVCDLGWSDDDCSCSENKENCIDPNGKTCSDHGTCDCGTCTCNNTVKEYFGQFCEDCLTCPKKCQELQPCVECYLKNPKAQFQKNNCSHCNFVAIPVTKLQVQEQEKERGCTYEDKENCQYHFKYKIGDQNSLIVHVQTDKECPEPVNMVAIIASVVGSVVGAGLLMLLLWKLLTEIHDRREFAKYTRELENSKWDAGENPIYKPSTSTFENPTYDKN